MKTPKLQGCPRIGFRRAWALSSTCLAGRPRRAALRRLALSLGVLVALAGCGKVAAPPAGKAPDLSWMRLRDRAAMVSAQHFALGVGTEPWYYEYRGPGAADFPAPAAVSWRVSDGWLYIETSWEGGLPAGYGTDWIAGAALYNFEQGALLGIGQPDFSGTVLVQEYDGSGESYGIGQVYATASGITLRCRSALLRFTPTHLETEVGSFGDLYADWVATLGSQAAPQ